MVMGNAGDGDGSSPSESVLFLYERDIFLFGRPKITKSPAALVT